MFSVLIHQDYAADRTALRLCGRRRHGCRANAKYFPARRIRIRPIRAGIEHRHCSYECPRRRRPQILIDNAADDGPRIEAGPPAVPYLTAVISQPSSDLTLPVYFLTSGSGTPLPNEGQLSGRIDHDDCDALGAAARAAFFVRPLCQAPRLEPASPHRRRSRTLAPLETRQGEAQARHRSDPRNCCGFRRITASESCRPPIPARSKWRCGRCSGARPVTMIAWESFGEGWVSDVAKELKLKDATVLRAPYGELPDLCAVDPASDIVFTWNGTTSGVRVPNADWIAADRAGTYDLRRDLGRISRSRSIGRSSMSSPSPGRRRSAARRRTACSFFRRARSRRLESYTPPWPLPKIFRMTKGGKLIEGIFQGETINTPSMLCVEDYLDTLAWAKSIGGLHGAASARRRQREGHRRLGGAHELDRFSRARSGVALQHIRVSEGRRSGREPAHRPMRRRPSSKASLRRSRRKASPTTSTPIAMRRPACASGAVRRSSGRRRSAHAVARLGLRQRQGRARQGGVIQRFVRQPRPPRAEDAPPRP